MSGRHLRPRKHSSLISDLTQFLGRLVPRSQCDYKLDNCSQRRCILRSPHYPGLYPANLTCTYHVFVLPGEIPPGKQALVRVSQPKSGKVWLEGSRVEKYGQVDTSLGLGPECDSLGDSVTAYDGPGIPGSTPSQPLIVFCRGGSVPSIVSSGPDMLIVFRSSPYSSPRTSPFRIQGFELEVKIDFIDTASELYTPRDRSTGAPDCRFSFTSVKRRRGVVKNLEHSMTGNTTCTWSFQALPGEVVWLSFLKFKVEHHKPEIYRTAECQQRLRLQDGHAPFLSSNSSVLGVWCDVSPPLVCHHMTALSPVSPVPTIGPTVGLARPCLPGKESYVSSGRGLTLTQTLATTTVVDRLIFEAQYEFVTLTQDGVSSTEEEGCDRQFRSTQAGGQFGTQDNAFSTPRNVFLFGRGGRSNISCTYRIVGAPGQRIQVKFSNISVGGRECRTVHDTVSARYRCQYGDKPRAGVLVTEVEGETEADMQCHCSVLHSTSVSSTSHILHLKYVAEGMNPSQDFRDFSLSGSFRFINTHCSDSTAVRGGGRVILDYHSSQQALCDRTAWGVKLSQGRNIHLTMPGLLLTSSSASCPSRARLVVRLGGVLHLICPHGPGSVSLFTNSSSSSSSLSSSVGGSPLLTVSVHLTGGGSGQYSFSWVSLSPIPPPSALLILPTQNSRVCVTPCPALGGCMEPALWCDGQEDCPSGWDESEVNCSHLLIPLHYLYLAAASILLACLGFTILLLCRLRVCKRNQGQSQNGTEHPTKRVSNGTVETMLNHKEEVS